MTTITISKKLIKNDDLVIIPRKEYERILRVAKKQGYNQLDKDLAQAIAEYKAGEVFGPFNSVKTFKDSLEK